MTKVKIRMHIILVVIAIMAIDRGHCGNLVIGNGEIKTSGFKECVVSNLGHEYNIIIDETGKNNMTTLVFGLVSWTCDNTTTGLLVSLFDCATCGVYCSYNQYLIKCKSKMVPFTVAIILSVVILLLTVIICLLTMRKKIHTLIVKALVLYLTIGDRKRAKRIQRYNKISGQSLEVKFKPIKVLSREIMEGIENERIRLSGRECIYSDILYNKSVDGKEADRLMEISEARLNHSQAIAEMSTRFRSQRKGSLSRMVVTATAATIPINSVYACDQMLYLKSNGRICYNDKCFDLSTYSLTLSDGETACFNDLNNNVLALKLDRIFHLSRYSKLYTTSKYSIKKTMTWNCLGAGRCWHGYDCGDGFMLNSLEKKSDNPHGYGCKLQPTSCDGYCHHGKACVWYRWEVLPQRNDTASVYQSVSELWSATLSVEYKGVSKKIEYNSNNPKFDLNKIIDGDMSHMPVYMHNVGYEKPMLKTGIVEYNGSYYNMDVSPHNHPVQNMIGDLQLTKDGSTAFYTTNVKCSTDMCDLKCRLNEPSLSRLKETSPYRLDDGVVLKTIIYGEYWLIHKVRVVGSATITFGNVDVKELIVKKPHCNIEVVMSYACTDCLQEPRVVLNSENVKQEGTMEYLSNCTWDRPTVSCNRDLYEMKQISKNENCRITIPLLNQTIDISFNYEYRGHLTDMKSVRTETTLDILSSMVTDSMFYTTLFSSLTSFFLITAAITTVTKLARLGVFAFARKEVERA